MTREEILDGIAKTDKVINNPIIPEAVKQVAINTKAKLQAQLDAMGGEAPKVEKEEIVEKVEVEKEVEKPAKKERVKFERKPRTPKAPKKEKEAETESPESKAEKSMEGKKLSVANCRELLAKLKTRREGAKKRVATRKKQGKPAQLTTIEVLKKASDNLEKKVETEVNKDGKLQKTTIKRSTKEVVDIVATIISGIPTKAERTEYINEVIADLKKLIDKVEPITEKMEKGGYMAKGGETNDNRKYWRVEGVHYPSINFVKEITLSKSSDEDEAVDRVQRMLPARLQEITSVEEIPMRFYRGDILSYPDGRAFRVVGVENGVATLSNGRGKVEQISTKKLMADNDFEVFSREEDEEGKIFGKLLKKFENNYAKGGMMADGGLIEIKDGGKGSQGDYGIRLTYNPKTKLSDLSVTEESKNQLKVTVFKKVPYAVVESFAQEFQDLKDEFDDDLTENNWDFSSRYASADTDMMEYGANRSGNSYVIFIGNKTKAFYSDSLMESIANAFIELYEELGESPYDDEERMARGGKIDEEEKLSNITYQLINTEDSFIKNNPEAYRRMKDEYKAQFIKVYGKDEYAKRHMMADGGINQNYEGLEIIIPSNYQNKNKLKGDIEAFIGDDYEDYGNKIFVRNKDVYGHGVTLSQLKDLYEYINNNYGQIEVELFAKGGRVYKDWAGRNSKFFFGEENLYPKYDNGLDFIADVSDYYKELSKDVNKNFSDEEKKDMIEVLKSGKKTYNDGATLKFAKGGDIGQELMGGQPNQEKPSGAILLEVRKNGKEIVVTEDDGKTKEVYVKSNGFSGYTLHYKGNQYEFAHSLDSYAKGGAINPNIILSFSFNTDNISLNEVKRIVEGYSKDWRTGGDISQVNFYVTLKENDADDLLKELKSYGYFYDFEKTKSRYAKGGDVNYRKNWEVTYITLQGTKGKKVITLGRMSDKDDVKNQLKRMDLNIREVTSIKEMSMFAKGGSITRNKNKNDWQSMFNFFVENNYQPIGKRDLINMAYESSNGIDSAIPQSMYGDVDNTAYYVYDYQTDKMGELVDLREKLKFSNVKVDVTIVQDDKLKYGNDLPSELQDVTFHQALNYVFNNDSIEQFAIRPKK